MTECYVPSIVSNKSSSTKYVPPHLRHVDSIKVPDQFSIKTTSNPDADTLNINSDSSNQLESPVGRQLRPSTLKASADSRARRIVPPRGPKASKAREPSHYDEVTARNFTVPPFAPPKDQFQSELTANITIWLYHQLKNLGDHRKYVEVECSLGRFNKNVYAGPEHVPTGFVLDSKIKPGVKYNNKLPREVTKTVRSNSEKLLSLRKDEFQGYSHAHQIDEFYKLPGVSDRVRKSTNGRDESEVIVKKTVDSLLVVLPNSAGVFKVKISLELPIFECTNNQNWENELQKLNFSREKARENLCFQDFVVSITQVDTKMTEVEIEMSQKKLLDLFLKCKRKDPICNDKTSKWLAFENFVASSVRAVDQLLENSSTWFDFIYLFIIIMTSMYSLYPSQSCLEIKRTCVYARL